MDKEQKEKSLKKLEKKKKWDEAAKQAQDIGYKLLDDGLIKEGLKYLDRSYASLHKTKKTEAIIVLYRKMINAARRGNIKLRTNYSGMLHQLFPLLRSIFRF